MTTTQSKGGAIKGILGVKLGMTQVFDENNKVIPVTVIEAGPCVVTQVRTLEKDGYEAVQMAFGAIDPRKVSKLKLANLQRLALLHVNMSANSALLLLLLTQ